MVKNRIRKLVKMVKVLVAIVLLLVGVNGCAAKGEGTTAGDEWKKLYSTKVTSQTYADGGGNRIVYYCCKTTYYDENGESIADRGETIAETESVDREALSSVIDWGRVSASRECLVGDWPAILCQLGGSSYLCWTISPEYSCAIEYDADAVAEEDIFRMAASVTAS